MNTVDNLCLHQLFEARVAATPEATAVVCDGESLSYQALNVRSNQLARHLQSMGVGSESLVGLCVERSIELVVGILAILKAGGAYVPVDPANPEGRVQYILQDSQVTTVLTQSKFEAKLAKADCDLVVHSKANNGLIVYPNSS